MAPTGTGGATPLFSSDLIETIATRFEVSPTDLDETITRVHDAFLDEAVPLHHYTASTATPEKRRLSEGLAELLFVTPPLSTHLPVSVPDQHREPVTAVHAEFARTRGVAEAVITRYDPLVKPASVLCLLHQAGLSPRQAEVQVLRNHGFTQPAIGAHLDMATNTVKVHCHRIDTKVAAAETLLDLVDT